MWHIIYPCILVVSCALRREIGATNPGIMLQLTKRGIKYAANEATRATLNHYLHTRVKDVEGSTKIKLGEVDYYLGNVMISDVSMPAIDISMNSPTVTSTVTNVGASLYGDWRYELKSLFKMSDHGSFTVRLSGASGRQIVSTDADASGYPSVRSLSCSMDIESLDFDFHGSHGFIYEWLIGAFKNDMIRSIEKTLCQGLSDYVDIELNQVLHNIQLRPHLRSNLLLDLSMLSAPRILNDTITASLKGEAYYADDVTKSSLQAAEIPVEGNPGRMLNAWISQFTLNTIGEIVHERGMLNFTLTRNKVSADRGDILNTTCPGKLCVGHMIPQLRSHFPWCTLGSHVSTSAPIRLKFHNSSASLNLALRQHFFVIMPNGTHVTAFVTQSNYSIDVTMKIEHSKVTGRFSNPGVSAQVVESHIGDISDSAMTYIEHEVATNFFMPFFNLEGARGIDIPYSDIILLTNSDINFIQGAMHISSDLIYVANFDSIDETGMSFDYEKDRSGKKFDLLNGLRNK